jgi:hypothetical protein
MGRNANAAHERNQSLSRSDVTQRHVTAGAFCQTVTFGRLDFDISKSYPVTIPKTVRTSRTLVALEPL